MIHFVFITRQAARRRTLRRDQQWLGHASLNTTMRQPGADLDLKRQALAQVVSEVLAPPKDGAFLFSRVDLDGWLVGSSCSKPDANAACSVTTNH